MRAFYWAVTLAVAAVLSLFAASNREAVSLGLWPLPFLVEVPLYLVAFGAAIVGFLTGALAAWIAGAHRRRELRRCRRRSEALARRTRGDPIAAPERGANAGCGPDGGALT